MTNIPKPHSSLFSFHLEKGQSSAEPHADSLKTPLTPPHHRTFPVGSATPKIIQHLTVLSATLSLFLFLFFGLLFFFPTLPQKQKLKFFHFYYLGVQLTTWSSGSVPSPGNFSKTVPIRWGILVPAVGVVNILPHFMCVQI